MRFVAFSQYLNFMIGRPSVKDLKLILITNSNQTDFFALQSRNKLPAIKISKKNAIGLKVQKMVQISALPPNLVFITKNPPNCCGILKCIDGLAN